MAAETSLSAILSNFTEATESAIHALPTAEALLPPEHGVTLLDAKNEIFLSYLQCLALRNLSIIHTLKEGGDFAQTLELNEAITKKLVEHRVYLERGVRSLEGKIKYQVDKVIVAAEEAERAKKATEARKAKKTNGVANGDAHDSEESSDNEDEEDSEDSDGQEIAASAHRANAANFARATVDNTGSARDRARGDGAGVYRPPRISATAMPTTDPDERGDRNRARDRRRPNRSATLDEFVATELSSAPVAEPSIGSTIDAGGRRMKDRRQLAKEQERLEYEETNLVRLPKATRKERAKEAARERGRGGGFGGEEWVSLGDSVDRIGQLTRGGRNGALERSRKRSSRAVEDGPRSDGIGDAFESRKRRILARKSRR